MTDVMQIQIVYAQPDQFWQQSMELPVGATVEQALESLDKNLFPANMQVCDNQLAVFGQLVKLGELLHDRDRIEILKPLLIDPKDIRRQRAVLHPYKKMKQY